MKTKLIIVMTFTAVVLAACGGGQSSAPRNLDSACSIIQQKKSWYKDMARVERKWGVPVSVQMATIYQESKFVGKARTPLKYKAGVIPMGRVSSAYGYAQALDGTWDWYKKETGKRSAQRDNFSHAVDFMGWYMNQTRKRNGIALSDARNQYLAYHDGHTGFKRGTYRKKSWLLRTAQAVEERALMYEFQLASCT